MSALTRWRADFATPGMSWKTTLVLLVAAGGLGAYLSLYEIRQPPPEERDRIARELLDIREESVSRLTLTTTQAEVTLTREEGTWRLAPSSLRADPDLVSRCLMELNPLLSERTLAGTPGKPLDLKAYGLHPSIASLTVVADQTPTTLLLGEEVAVGGRRYLQVSGRPEVFVVSSALFEAMHRPAEAFRDRLLVRFNSGLARRLTVRAPDTSWTVEGREGRWRLVEPLMDVADRAEISRLLSALGRITIRQVLEERPSVEQLPTYGFDHPKAEVTLTVREPEQTITLFFGNPLAEDGSLRYAKRDDEAALYAVAALEVDALLASPQGLRETRCFEVAPGTVERLEVRHGTTTWTMERSPEGWRLVGQAGALEVGRAQPFVRRVAELRVAGFVDEAPNELARYGLNPPEGSLTIWTGAERPPERLLIGSLLPEGRGRYGRIEGREALVRLPAEITELLDTTADSLSGPSAPQSTDGPEADVAPPSRG